MARTLGCISIDITDLPTDIFKYFSFSDQSILHARYGFTNEWQSKLSSAKNAEWQQKKKVSVADENQCDF